MRCSGQVCESVLEGVLDRCVRCSGQVCEGVLEN